MQKKIYIIGAGLAGLSAAYHLVKAGHTDIEIFESSPYAGGRCRSYFDEKLQADIDNGNHLVMGANESVMQLIKELGVEEKFNRFTDRIFIFFDNRKGERYYFKAPFPDIEIFGVTGFLNFLKFALIPTRRTVKQAFKLTPKLYSHIVNPIARSVLNTPSEVADANILRRVFIKLLTSKNGFDYYYPKKTWGDALISPLIEHLQKNGVKINFGKALKRLQTTDYRLQKLIFDDSEIDVSEAKVILAVPPYMASKLADITTPQKYNPIINIHFKCEHILHPQMIGIINSNVEWIFVKPGMISTTYSAEIPNLSEEELVKESWDACYRVLGLRGDIPPHRVIIEKRATFECTRAELAKRPSAKTKYDNLFLCGDYVNNGLPSTIEGACLSGKRVSELTK